MDGVESRQDTYRNLLTGLNDSKTFIKSNVRMFPAEVKKFRKEFPNLNIEIMNTSLGYHSKMHEVQITRK